MSNVVEITLEVNKAGDGFKVVQQGLAGINKEAGRASSGGRKFGRSMMQATGKAYAGLQKVERSLISLPSLIAAAGIGLLANSFLDAASTAENYHTRLEVLLGSQAEGNRLFKEMADYAGQVPFEYEKIMDAATTLSGVMRGGVDEITQWMPLIGDLAAATGMSFDVVNAQVVRMYSGGAAAADMFREKGVLAMLGFQTGVTYSAEETRQQLMDAWNDPQSKFRGATEKMADDWRGMTSILKDAWFIFRLEVMDSQVFSALKTGLGGVLDKIKELKEKGDIADWAEKFASIALKAFEVVGDGVLWVSKAFVGWQMIWNGLKAGIAELAEVVVSGLREILIPMQKVLDFLGADGMAKKVKGVIQALGDFSWAAQQEVKKNLAEMNKAIISNEGIDKAKDAWSGFWIKVREDSKKTTNQVMADTAPPAPGAQKKTNQTIQDEEKRHARIMEEIAFESTLRINKTHDGIRDEWMGINEEIIANSDNTGAKVESIWDQVSANLHTSMESGFFDLFKNGISDVGDAFNQFTDMMIESWARAMAQMATDALLFNSVGGGGGFGGILSGVGSWIAGLFHDGGVVGATSPAGYMAVSPAIFANAPRLHSGLAPDEFPAILQRGEEVIPRGGRSSAGIVEVNVYNNGSNTQARVKERKTGNGLSVDVMIEQIESGLSSRIAQGRGALQKTLTRTYGLNRAAGGFR